jgi:hypothetical protein
VVPATEANTDFNIFILDESDIDNIARNAHVKELADKSLLNILQPKCAKNAFNEKDERENRLFQLFLLNPLCKATLILTNDKLASTGKNPIMMKKLMAYVGLELAMSLIQIGSISKYWETKCFSGHHDFHNTMSHTDFQTIRGVIQFHQPTAYDSEIASKDPLWHSHTILGHFQQQCSAVAVPLGVSALDEASCQTSARTQAKMYMPKMPIKYGIQFYAIMGSCDLYCHIFCDNNAGNNLPMLAAEHYTNQFQDMHLPYNKTFEANPDGKVSGVSKDSPSALWTLQMSHQTKKCPDPSGKRNIFMDNYYTCHTLAKQVRVMSDDEIKITGTCQLNIIHKRNAVGIKKAIELLVDKWQGSWALVHAYNPSKEEKQDLAAKRATNKMKTNKKMAAKNKDVQGRKNEEQIEPQNVAKNCGYIMYKDSNIITFYTSNLAHMPKEWFTIGNDNEDAICCVHGLAPLH